MGGKYEGSAVCVAGVEKCRLLFQRANRAKGDGIIGGGRFRSENVEEGLLCIEEVGKDRMGTSACNGLGFVLRGASCLSIVDN